MVLCSPTAYIDPASLRHNIALIRGHCAEAVQFCAVVKADAYGHDSRLVVSCLAQNDAESFAVYTIEEAEHIHDVACGRDILVIEPIFAGASAEQIRLAAERRFHCTVCSKDAIAGIQTALASVKQPLNVHLKIDTGMGRSGCRTDEVAGLLEAIAAADAIRLTGVYSHLATADEPDLTFARQQLSVFEDILHRYKQFAAGRLIRHACNSAGTLRLPSGHLDMVRVGISLYGYLASDLHGQFDLRPALRLEAPLVHIKRIAAGQSCGYGRTFTAAKDMLIGIVPVGYADGLSRYLSNRAKLRIGPHYVPIVGRVSMDQTIIDLTNAPNPRQGDCVTVIDDRPDSPCNAQALADLARTIPHEVLTAIGTRVVRVRADAAGSA